MAAYGDDDTVATMLEPSTPTGFSESLTARIAAMREVVSRLIDEETGRSWGVAGTSEIRQVPVADNTVFLPVPARTITAVTTYQYDHGGVLGGPTVLTTDQWWVDLRDRDRNILSITGGFFNWSWFRYNGLVEVTGTWADTGTDTDIPPEINWACNYITARSIAEEQASPAGFVGQNGEVVPIRNPWSDPKVKKILRKYELVTHGLVL